MLSPAVAQQVMPTAPPMDIQIMRGTGDCEPDCPEWIAAQGEIKADSQQKLRRVIQSLKGRKLPILLNSPGGHVDSGLAMGRMVREAGLTTAIGSSSLPAPCEPKDAACLTSRRKGPLKGQFNLARAHCASACTFILAGGTKRVVHPTARLGVHQLTYTLTPTRIYRRYRIQYRMVNGRKIEVSRTLISQRVVTVGKAKQTKTPESSYTKLQKHFQQMGLAATFSELTRATPAESMHYLTTDQKRATLIATDTEDFVTALGFNPASRYFSRPPRQQSYVDSKAFGLFRGELTVFEFTINPDLKLENAPVSIRILQGDKAVDATGLRLQLSLNTRDNPEAVTATNGSNEMLVLDYSRAQLCKLEPYGTGAISLYEKGQSSAPAVWTRSDYTMRIIPLDHIRATLCPQRHWER
jgi:hypothetical protein